MTPKRRNLAVAGILCVMVGILAPVAVIKQKRAQAEHSSKWYQWGEQTGKVEGSAAYNSGRPKPDRADLEPRARAESAGMSFKGPEDRRRWMEGYYDGFFEGWQSQK